MRTLARYLLRCLAFLGFTAILYLLLIGLWGAVVPSAMRRNLKYPRGGSGQLWTRLHDLRGHGPVDVLVLGGSHAYRGFDPRLFRAAGYSLYNLGSSAQTMLQTEVLVDRYLDRLNPKLTIIEVYPVAFQLDGVESSLDLIANGGVDADMAEMAVREGNVRTINALIYATEEQVFGIGRNFIGPKHPPGSPDRYVDGGFVERKSGHFAVPHHAPKARNTVPLEDQLDAFRRVLQKLSAGHRKVVLVETPVTHWLYASYKDHAAHERRMSSFAPYINMNGMAGLNDSLDYFDISHMNQRGVDIFDKALLDTLARRGLLPSTDGTGPMDQSVPSFSTPAASGGTGLTR